MPASDTPSSMNTGGSCSAAACGAALGVDNFFQLGLRLPERGESAAEYFDAELLDRIDHIACVSSARAG